MAILASLEIQQLRNISHASLALHPRWNIFFGANGSGKTALLEAIYCLSYTHSFRFHQGLPLIQYHKEKMAIHAVIEEEFLSIPINITKTQQGETLLFKAGLRERSRAECAKRLPVQVLTPDSFRLWLDGPKERRAFLDWGVFHVEHRYGALWQAYERALRQRNKLLKEKASQQELIAWEEALDEYGAELTTLRQSYLEYFLANWQAVWKTFAPHVPLNLVLDPGWDLSYSLKEHFKRLREQERRVGYTLVGPHRAELQCCLYGIPAAQILSRGQLKLLICAMFIAQAQVLTQLSGKRSILLCDDLACELDTLSRQMVLTALQALPNQVFMTAIEPQSLSSLMKEVPAMFHVEQGVVEEACTKQV